MDSVDIEVLETALSWWRDGNEVLVATVVRTWGSAPRPVGALLSIRGDGLIKGSVSGGCIEDDMSRRVKNKEFRHGLPAMVRYGVKADEAYRFGLPCGGTVELVLERLSRESGHLDVLTSVLNGQTVVRILDVHTGNARVEACRQVIPTSFDGRFLRSVHGPELRLVLVGAGQLSEYVARLAIPLGYRVIVCDPREEYQGTWDVPRIEFSREMPDDLLLRMGADINTAVLTLTHDPKLDDMALLEAIKSNAFYVGAIGSRANSARRRERLQMFDLSVQQIEKLHAPVGLYIGAQTPAEIAISIVAEMTAVRRNVPVLQGHAMREALTEGRMPA